MNEHYFCFPGDLTKSIKDRVLAFFSTNNNFFYNFRFSQPVGKLGSGMAVKLSSRGACFDDLDNDGDLDARGRCPYRR